MEVFNKESFFLGSIILVITLILLFLPKLWYDLLSGILYGLTFIILVISGFFFIAGGYQDNEKIINIALIMIIGGVIALIILDNWSNSYWLEKIGRDAVVLVETITEYMEVGWSFEEYILPMLVLLSVIPLSYQNYNILLTTNLILGIILIILGLFCYLFISKNED
ncbi:MAG: hypothetical protein ACTSO9_21010 [Candidatus Helarchaeota archaeon]